MEFGKNYPRRKPKVLFKTEINHPSVTKRGVIVAKFYQEWVDSDHRDDAADTKDFLDKVSDMLKN